ncbi:unnamed protein product [Cochlearia groenlandica]
MDHNSKNLRDFYGINGQISPEIVFDISANLRHDQSQHPPYIPPFHIDGFVQRDGNDVRKRVKEVDFMDNNSSIDFGKARSVSTGLGLSLDNARLVSSSSSSSTYYDGSASLLSLVGDDIDRELQRQDAEINRFLKIQEDQLRHAILDKIQSTQRKTVFLMDKIVVERLREKDEELEMINRKNNGLELRIEQLTIEAEAWQQRANYNEDMIAALNYNLERVHYGRARESIVEGCGDSEVDDISSCFINGINNKKKTMTTTEMMCRFCGVKEVCMLLLPCKHMCLCKDCEKKLSTCPLCQSSKFLGMEVYM